MLYGTPHAQSDAVGARILQSAVLYGAFAGAEDAATQAVVIIILLLVCGYLYLDNKGLLEFNTDIPTEDVEVPTGDVKTEEKENDIWI